MIPNTKSLGISQNIFCKLHGKNYLVLDTKSFKLMCKICSDNPNSNLITNDKILEDQNISNNIEFTNNFFSSDNEDDNIECDLHLNKKGSFYCDDCKVFLCEFCFVKFHRAHNSNLPEEIAKNFKNNLKELSNGIFLLEPKIIESIKIISDVEARIKKIRESSFKRLEDFCLNINKLCVKQGNAFLEEYKLSMENIDIETNTILLRLNGFIMKIKNNLEEIYLNKSIIEKSNIKDFQLCKINKDKKKLFQEAKNIFTDSKYLLNYIIKETVQIAKLYITNNDSFIQEFYKKQKLYLNSVVNSIQKGISSFSFKIKRFTKYSKNGIKYFKNSSIIFKSFSPISIVGFNVCGLVRSHFKREHNDIDDKNIQNLGKKIQNGNINRLSTKMNDLNGFPNEKIGVPIRILIKESCSDDIQNEELIFEEEFFLTDIQNTIDPTITLYLKKCINIKPEKLYIFSIVNLDKEAYLELWNGEVAKYYQKEYIQSLKCNTNNLKFVFYAVEGIESDFNEFDSGIFADILYSFKDN